MKRMSFNSSCAYAGLANMLETLGVDTEDRLIALDMGLPYLFAREEGQYRAGPMLQSARWFDLYLGPRGFALKEEKLPQKQLPQYLPAHAPAMLGLLVGANSKHAVVFTDPAGGAFRFINNRHPSTSEPDELTLTAAELLSRTDPQVLVATLARITPEPVDIKPLLTSSLDTLTDYRRDMEALRRTYCDRQLLRTLMNTHFRAFLLDSLTMMELIHEEELAEQLTLLQSALLQSVRSGAEGTLDSLLPMDEFMRALEAYEALIAAKTRSI